MASAVAQVVEVGGAFAHPVRIEAGSLGRLGERLIVHGAASGSRVLLVVDSNVLVPHAERARASLAAAGFQTSFVALEASEDQKTIGAVERIWQAALASRLGRRDTIVALGGGLIGDVAGFAAASYLRGVRLVQCPTTLLAMVDASTGGKTGINLTLPDGSLGKNLAGAFWPPIEVVVDPETLATLPERERRGGLAECVKHAIIDGEEHLAFLESVAPAVRALEPVATTAVIARSVAVKARIVTADPRELGERAVLNLGHTFGHAIETLPELDLTHGEAVAIGVVAACAAADPGGGGTLRSRVERLLAACGLPTRLPVPVGIAPIGERMGFDKKAQAGQVRFVLPRGPGEVAFGCALEPAVVAQALRAIGAV